MIIANYLDYSDNITKKFLKQKIISFIRSFPFINFFIFLDYISKFLE